jgi:hypothetical protein
MLNLDSDEIISASVSDQLISSQLNRVQIGLHLFSWRGGAEWRCVDFELGRGCGGALRRAGGEVIACMRGDFECDFDRLVWSSRHNSSFG